MTTETWWDMETLKQETKESRPWIMANMIKNEKVWQEIEPFSHKPKHNNDEYRFIGPNMQQYLIDNFKSLKEG